MKLLILLGLVLFCGCMETIDTFPKEGVDENNLVTYWSFEDETSDYSLKNTTENITSISGLICSAEEYYYNVGEDIKPAWLFLCVHTERPELGCERFDCPERVDILVTSWKIGDYVII